MPTPPHLTEDDIQHYIPDPYFSRGKKYFAHNPIHNPAVRNDRLEGYCTGTEPEPYWVVVTFAGDNLRATHCSCPLGGQCKHVVALLLLWANEPEGFVKRQAIDVALRTMTREELVALVDEMLKREPQLEDLLNTSSPPKIQKRQTRRPRRLSAGPSRTVRGR